MAPQKKITNLKKNQNSYKKHKKKNHQHQQYKSRLQLKTIQLLINLTKASILYQIKKITYSGTSASLIKTYIIQIISIILAVQLFALTNFTTITQCFAINSNNSTNINYHTQKEIQNIPQSTTEDNITEKRNGYNNKTEGKVEEKSEWNDKNDEEYKYKKKNEDNTEEDKIAIQEQNTEDSGINSNSLSNNQEIISNQSGKFYDFAKIIIINKNSGQKYIIHSSTNEDTVFDSLHIRLMMCWKENKIVHNRQSKAFLEIFCSNNQQNQNNLTNQSNNKFSNSSNHKVEAHFKKSHKNKSPSPLTLLTNKNSAHKDSNPNQLVFSGWIFSNYKNISQPYYNQYFFILSECL